MFVYFSVGWGQGPFPLEFEVWLIAINLLVKNVFLLVSQLGK